MRIFLLFALLSLAVPAFAHEGMVHEGCDPGAAVTAGDLTIGGAFSRAMLPNAQTAGGYLTIANAGAADDTLQGVASEAAQVVQLHEMTMDADVMKMGEVPGGIVVPAGGSVVLEPKGYHIMFMGVGTPFKEGECVQVLLQFATAGAVMVDLAVGGIAADGPPEHAH